MQMLMLIITNSRHRIAASGHLTPLRPRPVRGTALPGEVAVAQAADRLASAGTSSTTGSA
ncbi:hypothetical protein [Streptomyces aurantiacus]|uniref:hypothetical protein n=1 Tax=Streptomyces aurantiacus TaxID=47760 RepID=UPI0027D7D21E|nr:hypothetical protein [Streptomyces aurantiacus]